MKCIECNGLGITIFIEAWHDYSYIPASIRFDVHLCKACHGVGKQSLLKNLLWRYKYKDEVAEGGTCLVHFLNYPPIAFGGVLNARKSLSEDMLQSLKNIAKEQYNVSRPTKIVQRIHQ